jgi:hypothetical protein
VRSEISEPQIAPQLDTKSFRVLGYNDAQDNIEFAQISGQNCVHHNLLLD